MLEKIKTQIKKILPKKLIRSIATLLSWCTIKVNGKYVEAFLTKVDDFRFLVTPDDMSVGRELRKNGSYGQSELQRIFRIISIDSSVVFVGGHIGALAIPTAKKCKSLIIIEANPITYKFLLMNLTLNNILNVKVYNAAAGEKQGMINFLLSKINSGGSKREPLIKDDMYYYDKPKKILVPVVTLDSICCDQNENFDLVFMDIEGSEIFALKGAVSLLKRTKALMIEFIPHHLTNIANCTIEEFLVPIVENFNYCYVPSKNMHIHSANFIEFFRKMFSLNEIDDSLVFTKEFFNFNKI
jgi:FkbM family methyltransferase